MQLDAGQPSRHRTHPSTATSTCSAISAMQALDARRTQRRAAAPAAAASPCLHRLPPSRRGTAFSRPPAAGRRLLSQTLGAAAGAYAGAARTPHMLAMHPQVLLNPAAALPPPPPRSGGAAGRDADRAAGRRCRRHSRGLAAAVSCRAVQLGARLVPGCSAQLAAHGPAQRAAAAGHAPGGVGGQDRHLALLP